MNSTLSLLSSTSSKHNLQVPIPQPTGLSINSTQSLPSTTIKSDINQAYYHRGESVNRSSVIVTDALVSPLDLTIIIFVLLLWLTTILMCINKWGKIRMIEAYQPTFQAADEEEFTTRKTTVRQASSSCKSALNRSTIRIIPSEVDLVNMHDSYSVGVTRSVDVPGILPLRSTRAGTVGLDGSGGTLNGGVGRSNNGDSNTRVGREIRNIPRIEISPISCTEERKCKSLEDVRVRLLS
ncbi:uncharacterized protein LOC107362832 [Tetranychus urticae]|uniref:Fibronectin type III domain-containing protein n=1 Tax=Tetranychus urticae TaxID=32264 RepID=T1KC91_TETUR|nr:uncharacterized protein LOC107362832 [Tetranychus urticae]